MNKTTQTSIKIKDVEIPLSNNKSKFIPSNAKNFIDHGDILETLAIGIRDNMSVLLMGESGTGKTSAIRHLASETKNGLRRVNLNGGTTADELIGRLLINDKGTYWVDGVLTEAMRNGEWIVLDEINAALPEVLFVLQSIMDDDGYLVLNEKDDKEIVHKHPNFRLFATCNPPEYAGTKEMNKALLSRFGICISAEFPPENIEKDIIHHHLGAAISQSEIAIKLVDMANETRLSKENGTIDYAINTRDILNTLKLAQFVNPIEALCLAFANKLDPIDRKAIKSLGKLHLPATKKAALATRKAVTSPSEMKIGGNYVLTQDTHYACYGITKDTNSQEEYKTMNLGDVISNKETYDLTKNQEFTVIGTFYEEGPSGASTEEVTTLGEKAASLIELTSGELKKSQAVIIHHKDIDDTLSVLQNINEIN